MSLLYALFTSALIVVLFIVDSRTMSQQTTNFYHTMEVCATIVFTVEYVLRLYSCVESEPEVEYMSPVARCRTRIWLMCSMASVIDAISLISLYLDVCITSNVFRGVVSLRLLRLFTLFRLERKHKFFSPILLVVSNKRTELGATLGIAGLLLLISSTLMYYVESGVNEKFESILSSMWWGTETLTTVGYGDIVPITPAGRALGSVVAFAGLEADLGRLVMLQKEVLTELQGLKTQDAKALDPTPPVRSTPPDPPEELLERAAFLSDEEVQSQLETGSVVSIDTVRESLRQGVWIPPRRLRPSLFSLLQRRPSKEAMERMQRMRRMPAEVLFEAGATVIENRVVDPTESPNALRGDWTLFMQEQGLTGPKGPAPTLTMLESALTDLGMQLDPRLRRSRLQLRITERCDGMKWYMVSPEANTLVLLLADRVLHEVRSAYAERYALSMWFCGQHAEYGGS
eukprot:g30162.t1